MGKRREERQVRRSAGIWMVSVLIGLLGTCCIQGLQMTEKSCIQQGIASSVIRFHVLADSDSDRDQEVKMKVKEEIVSYLEPILRESESVEKSRKLIAERLPQIQKMAQQAVERQGEKDPVTVGFAKTWFPQKVYGDCTFPEGVYEALQVKIGEAQGKNWWCVLYPGLCFRQSVQGVVTEEGKQRLAGVLTEEEMRTVLEQGKVRIRFRWFS